MADPPNDGPERSSPMTWASAAPEAVVRQRLEEPLRVLRPLTLVSAPAGYGKTALVDCWAAGTLHRVVSVPLDHDATAPRRFWAAALECLDNIGLDVAGVDLGSAEGPDLRPLIRRVTAHEHTVVLVVDTGQFSLSRSVGAGLDWVLRRCRGKLSLILVTRTDPPLPLNRYRLDGAITELRAADLTFTVDEVAVLMKHRRLDLTPADVSLLHARTGGWPAGLVFAAMTLSGSSSVEQALKDFRGDTGNVAEYLFSEVLSTQSQASRDFLLRTSVADDLDPDLIEALTGQRCDPGLLERMARSNAFIERVPGQGDRYRYQLLFLEFLRGQLAFERPDLVGALHRVTAEWLAENGQVLAAVRHAARAGEWQTATDLLVTRVGVARVLMGWQSERLRSLFRDLPADLPGATAAITRAALSISELDVGRGQAHLTVARTLLSSGAGPVAPANALAVAVLSAIGGSLGADTGAGLRAALVAERALRLTPSQDRDAQLELSALVAGCKARVLFERGDLAAAAEALSEGSKAAEAGRLDGVLSELKGMAAVVDAASGQLRRATELAVQVLPSVSDPDERVTGPGLVAASLALAWVHLDQSALQPPRDLLATVDRQRASYDSRVLAPVLALLRARLLQSGHQDELALAELRGAGDGGGLSQLGAPATGWLAAQLVATEATSLLRLGRPDEAVTLLEGFDGPTNPTSDLVLHRARVAAGKGETETSSPLQAAADGPLAEQVDQLLLHAETWIEHRAPARASEALGRALRLAAREQLRRPFLELGEEVHALLDRLDLTRRNTWLRSPAASHAESVANGPRSARPSASDVPDSTTPLVVMPLTAKESEVLGYLGELLTTDEIAATMFVSVNTVRSHVRSILRKLGASRRNEAVRRAWEIGLLAPEDPSAPSLAR
jgi:LuxR family transcriptional regulator, maltose regulon positive regulatory protein